VSSLPSYLEQPALEYRYQKIVKNRTRRKPDVTLKEFSKRIWPRYIQSRFLDILDDALLQVTLFIESGGKQGIGRLIIEAPPRHGKTVKVSRIYPTWHLARNPNHRAMLISYGDSLARKNGRTVRNFAASKVFAEMIPDVRLASDSKAANSWDIEGFDGGLEALGILGATTGKGAHLMVIDDPIKSRKEAESPTYRDSCWDAFKDDLTTRLEPGGAIIIMMQRFHQDDLAGRALRDMASENWVRLRLPAIRPEPEQEIPGDFEDWRKPGEALMPERYPIEVLKQTRNRLGAYSWGGQYQQNPTPSEGGVMKRKWFKPRLRHAPPMRKTVRFWDLAMSEKTSADYTAGLKMGDGVDDHSYIFDVAREQVELAELPAFIKDVILSDGPKVIQGFEMKGYMTRAIAKLGKDPDLRMYTLMGYDVDTDKLTRVLPAAARMSLKLIHIIEGGYAQVFEDECCAFPNGSYDDQVDAFSGAWRMLYGDEDEEDITQDRRNYIGYNRDNDNGKHKKRGIRKGWDR
jgi:predicted phage terminase large subunit-like protein